MREGFVLWSHITNESTETDQPSLHLFLWEENHKSLVQWSGKGSTRNRHYTPRHPRSWTFKDETWNTPKFYRKNPKLKTGKVSNTFPHYLQLTNMIEISNNLADIVDYIFLLIPGNRKFLAGMYRIFPKIITFARTTGISSSAQRKNWVRLNSTAWSSRMTLGYFQKV